MKKLYFFPPPPLPSPPLWLSLPYPALIPSTLPLPLLWISFPPSPSPLILYTLQSFCPLFSTHVLLDPFPSPHGFLCPRLCLSAPLSWFYFDPDAGSPPVSSPSRTSLSSPYVSPLPLHCIWLHQLILSGAGTISVSTFALLSLPHTSSPSPPPPPLLRFLPSRPFNSQLSSSDSACRPIATCLQTEKS